MDAPRTPPTADGRSRAHASASAWAAAAGPEGDVTEPLLGVDSSMYADLGASWPPAPPCDDEEGAAGDDVVRLAWLDGLPWWRQPSPQWLLPVILLFAVATGILMAARMEMYLALVCEENGVDPAPAADGAPRTLTRVPTSACRQSPFAQEKLSFLTMTLLLTNGIASALSTGFWSRFSDRVGRLTVLAVSFTGVVAFDAVVLVAASVPLHALPFGARFLAIGSTIEGLLGGFSAITAMSMCYLSDITPSGTRARLFAMTTGVLFAGVAFGPMFGSVITAVTQEITTALWTGSGIHVMLLVAFVLIPESLSMERRRVAGRAHRRAADRDAATRKHAPLRTRVRALLLQPLRALEILWPARNYNLLFLSCAHSLESACIAIVPIKIQYVHRLEYNWNSTIVGLYISATSITRMVALTALVPLVIRLIHRPPTSLGLPHDTVAGPPEGHGSMRADAELHGAGHGGDAAHADTHGGAAPPEQAEEQWSERARQLHLIHDSRLDRRIGTASALLTGVGFFVSAFARSAPVFVLGSVLAALGGSVGPAISSLGLALIARPQDAGRLFGAWAVLSTIASSILGPILFTATFSSTVTWSPALVFYVVGGMQLTAALFLRLVTLRSPASLPSLPPRPSAM
ncbi:hypothetical protein MSPP1_004091 [Malassezia sp. CBS 17886]|nr:hypothetical protein MSPP1_004091 [Malassezia sp. CBS 17886]